MAEDAAGGRSGPETDAVERNGVSATRSGPERAVRRRAARRSDLLILAVALGFMAAVALGVVWLATATGLGPGAVCTPYHQALGHC